MEPAALQTSQDGNEQYHGGGRMDWDDHGRSMTAQCLGDEDARQTQQHDEGNADQGADDQVRHGELPSC